MEDVEFAYVHDFGTGEEFVARRDGGATLNGEPLDPEQRRGADARGRRASSRRGRSGSRRSSAALEGKVYRMRVIGLDRGLALLRGGRALRRHG